MKARFIPGRGTRLFAIEEPGEGMDPVTPYFEVRNIHFYQQCGFHYRRVLQRTSP